MANMYQSNGSVSTLALTDGTTETSPVLSSKLVGTIFASVGNTDTLNANSGTQNFATTYTIPANYLVANKVLRVTLCFSVVTSAASRPNVGVDLALGATTVFTAAANVMDNSTSIPICMRFYIQGSAAAGAAAAVYTHLETQQGAFAAIFSPFNIATTATQPLNVATNGTLVIQPKYRTNNSTAGNSITLQQFIVEALN